MISQFDADMVGTEILEPLQHAINLSYHAPQTRIFLLTDGEDDNKSAVIETAKILKPQIRIYTFGIGSGCDVSMVQEIAKNGRGSCSLVEEQSEDLNAKVITSLMHAFEPSLQQCELEFAGEKILLGEVFRNQSLTRCKIISR